MLDSAWSIKSRLIILPFMLYLGYKLYRMIHIIVTKFLPNCHIYCRNANLPHCQVWQQNQQKTSNFVTTCIMVCSAAPPNNHCTLADEITWHYRIYNWYQSQKSFLVKEKNRNNFALEEMKRTYDSLKELISKYKSNEIPMESLYGMDANYNHYNRT